MADRILGACVLAFAALVAWLARDYVAPIAYEPVGPRAVPMLLAAFLAMVGAWLLVRGPGRLAAEEGGDATRPLAELTRAPTRWRVLAAIGAVLAYAWLFTWLGFSLATLAMTVVIGPLFGGTWKQGLAAGVVLGVGFYLLFDRLLDVVLPTGVLGILTGGGA